MTFSAVLLRVLALAVQVRSARRLWEAEHPLPRTEVGGFTIITLSDLQGAPPLPEEIAFRSFCQTLSPARVYMTILVMCAGRGDFGSSFDILECYAGLSDVLQRPEWSVNHMLGKHPLPEYLARGVRLLDEMGVDIDGLC
jgi:hypothetical protein